jgi:hypothetical protein
MITFFFYSAYLTIKGIYGDDIFQELLRRSCILCCKIEKLNDVVNENPDIFWKCLDDDDRNWSIQEEENMRKNFEFRCMLDTSFKSL